MVEDYPRTLLELERRFATDATCLEYLHALRWPDGFVCPGCGHHSAWQTRRDLLHCRRCSLQTSVTAGTILHRTRKPLALWFRAMWQITSQKHGANALGLQRVLGLGSYQTAWEWLHRLRRAMVRPGRDQLSGVVEVDETYLGGTKPGKRGRGARGKAVVGVAVEDKGHDGIGRIRLAHLENASGASLASFVEAVAQPRATVRTDKWSAYNALGDNGFDHVVAPSLELKLVHLVAALLKRWLLGTYQGAVRPSHLTYYLDEFTFRFNRRGSKSRGKLFYRLVQQAMMVDAVPGPQLQGPALDFLVSADNRNLDPIDRGRNRRPDHNI